MKELSEVAGLELFQDRILVKQDEMQEEITKGGIIIPDTAKEKPFTGTVIKTGDDVENRYIKPGCRIIFGKYAGSEITLDKEDYMITRENDIIGILHYDPKKD